jgi:signal transduction histidine kinase/CheY-like chemotaxis protein
LKQLFIFFAVAAVLYAGSAYQKVVLGTFYTLEDAQTSVNKLREKAGEAVEANRAAYGYELVARASGDLFIVVAEPVESYSDGKKVAEFYRPYYGQAQILRYRGENQPEKTLPAEEAPETLPIESAPSTVAAAAKAPAPAKAPATAPEPQVKQEAAESVAETPAEAPEPKAAAAVSEKEAGPAAVAEVSEKEAGPAVVAEASEKEPEPAAEKAAAEAVPVQAAETAEAEPGTRPIGPERIRELLASMDEASRTALLREWSPGASREKTKQPSVGFFAAWQSALVVLLLGALALLGWRYRQLQRRRALRAAEADAANSGLEVTDTEETEQVDDAVHEEPGLSIVHEVYTSAGMIKKYLRGLRTQELNARVRQYLEDIEERTSFLERLAAEAEHSGGSSRHCWMLERYDFNINDVLEGISRLVSNRAMQSGDEVLFMVEKEVPIQLAGDGMRLQQVLLSLLENALDATKNGEIRLKVEHIVTVGSWTTLSFAVEDTGEGMDEKAVEHLFDDGNNGSVNLDKELIKMMGGTLNIKSEAGKGCRIYFTANFNVQSTMERRKYRIPDEKGFERKLLVVDGNTTAAAALRHKLEYFRLSVDVANSWDEAMHLLNLHADAYGHVFINDALLVGPKQETMIKQLDSSYAEPVIVTYENGCFDDRFENPVYYLEKPYSMQRILLLLQELAKERSGFTAPQRAPFRHAADDDASPRIQSVGVDEDLKESFGFEMAEQPLRLEGRHILLADGNRTNQGILKWILEEAGLLTTIVASSEEALKLLDASGETFDMVLLDVQVPLKDRTVIDALHGGNASGTLPVIAMSTSLPENVETWVETNHLDGYLQKPIYKEDLFDLFKEVLHRRAAAQKS